MTHPLVIEEALKSLQRNALLSAKIQRAASHAETEASVGSLYALPARAGVYASRAPLRIVELTGPLFRVDLFKNAHIHDDVEDPAGVREEFAAMSRSRQLTLQAFLDAYDVEP